MADIFLSRYNNKRECEGRWSHNSRAKINEKYSVCDVSEPEKGGKSMDDVNKALTTILEDWQRMQQTEGDEGEEAAERFETNFYRFADEFKRWFKRLNHPPQTLEELEDMKEVKSIQQSLPDPLQLNFTLEMEEIIDGIETKRFD